MANSEAHEIQSVISRYTNCVNRRDWDVLPTIFTQDALWSAPDLPDATFTGLAAILSGIPMLVEGTTSLIQLNTPSDIRNLGDTASAQCSIRETGSIASQSVTLRGAWLVRRRTGPRSWRLEVLAPHLPPDRELLHPDFQYGRGLIPVQIVLDLDDLMAKARAATGLNDFGDPWFMPVSKRWSA